MASEPEPVTASCEVSDRVKGWETSWEQGDIGFHMKNVHKMLQKHLPKLNPEGNLKKIFVPLCGKSVDMKWLSDQGITTVGVEGVQLALDEFFTESGLEKVESEVTGLGPTGKLLQSKDSLIKLYCGDMMQFSTNFEGTFDAIWDRGSLVALSREDVPGYIKILKDLLNTGGHILVEVMEYQAETMMDLDESYRPPPPHAMYQNQMKELFEPQCTLEQIDRGTIKFYGTKDVDLVYYVITKK